MGAEIHYDLKSALDGADVIYVLRLQFERHRMGLLPSIKSYVQQYGITAERAKWAKPNALIMHPGPMNRGIEISAEVADAPESVIVNQVANGIPIRMAVLYLLETGWRAAEKSGAGGVS